MKDGGLTAEDLRDIAGGACKALTITDGTRYAAAVAALRADGLRVRAVAGARFDGGQVKPSGAGGGVIFVEAPCR